MTNRIICMECIKKADIEADDMNISKYVWMSSIGMKTYENIYNSFHNNHLLSEQNVS